MKRRKKCSIRVSRNRVNGPPLRFETQTQQQFALFSKLCRIYWRYLMKWVSLGSKIHGYQPRITMLNNFVKNTTRMRILMRVEGKIFQIRSDSCQHGQIRRVHIYGGTRTCSKNEKNSFIEYLFALWYYTRTQTRCYLYGRYAYIRVYTRKQGFVYEKCVRTRGVHVP